MKASHIDATVSIRTAHGIVTLRVENKPFPDPDKFGEALAEAVQEQWDTVRHNPSPRYAELEAMRERVRALEAEVEASHKVRIEAMPPTQAEREAAARRLAMPGRRRKGAGNADA